MVTIEQVIYIVPILALTASIIYYALNLRTANKTQQHQLEIETTVTFRKTVGGHKPDRGVAVAQTSDGGYVAVGVTESFGSGGEDVYLVRTNSMGEILWNITFGGELRDNGWAVKETKDGGFLVAGFSNSFGDGAFDFYLIRTDLDGNLLWSKTIDGGGDEYCWDMDSVDDTGYILAGETGTAGQYRTGNKNFYLVRIDNDGQVLWNKTIGGTETDRCFAVQSTLDGGFILVGSTTSFGAGDTDVYLVKTDDKGDVEWEKTFGTEHFDMGHDVKQRPDGGYIVFGYTDSYGAKNRDAWVISLDSEGNLEWHKLLGGDRDDRSIRGVLTDDGGIVLTGYSKSFGQGIWEVYLQKLSREGDVLWTRTYGGALPETGYGIATTSDGGFILTGQTFNDDKVGDLLLIKTDNTGIFQEP